MSYNDEQLQLTRHNDTTELTIAQLNVFQWAGQLGQSGQQLRNAAPCSQ